MGQVKLGQRRYCPAYLSWRWVVGASVSFLLGNQTHLLLSLFVGLVHGSKL